MTPIYPNSIHEGDCLNLLDGVADKSVNLILADNPYGMTSNGQDIQIPLFDHFNVLHKGKMKAMNTMEYFDYVQSLDRRNVDELYSANRITGLWNQYKRVLAPGGNIVLFAKGRFMAHLISYDPEFFKYDLVWHKILVSGQLNAKNMPMSQHENILVFNESIAKATYNPQMKQGPPLHGKGTSHMNKEAKNQNYGKVKPVEDTRKGSTEKYPTSIWVHAKPHPSVAKHRTEKPVELLKEAIETYSNIGDVVLDNASGSMGVGVACIDTDRKYILMEKDREEFLKGQARLLSHLSNKMIELADKPF